jgi:hypothetical protein
MYHNAVANQQKTNVLGMTMTASSLSCDLQLEQLQNLIRSFSYRVVLPNGTPYQIQVQAPDFSTAQYSMDVESSQPKLEVTLAANSPLTVSYLNEVSGKIDYLSATRDLTVNTKVAGTPSNPSLEVKARLSIGRRLHRVCFMLYVL